MSSFTVTSDARARIIHIHLHGLLSMADVQRLAGAQAAHASAIARSGEGYAALVDTSASPIQTAEVAEALKALSNRPDFRPARIAFVCGLSPAKMQVRRVNADKPARYFMTDNEAIAWLKAETPAAAPSDGALRQRAREGATAAG